MYLIKREWPLLISVATTALFLVFGKNWLIDLSNPLLFAFVLAWLFGTILISAFSFVRHAEGLAWGIGEPVGTLILTICMGGMKIVIFSAVMFTTQGASPLARDTMLAIVMIALNALVGACLLLGGLRYHQQTYDLYGANTFLVVILPVSILGLVLPSFTVSSLGPTLSTVQSIFLIIMSVGLYGVFLAIQTTRYRDYFVLPTAAYDHHSMGSPNVTIRLTKYHAVLLITYALPILLLAKQIAVPINYGITVLRAPAALGGLLVAVLILAPDCMAAVRAALGNQIQRSINLSLGTALSSICLTIPAVLIIGFISNKTIILGLNEAYIVILLLSLSVSIITLAVERTNLMLGAVHLILFVAYLMLIFEKLF